MNHDKFDGSYIPGLGEADGGAGGPIQKDIVDDVRSEICG